MSALLKNILDEIDLPGLTETQLNLPVSGICCDSRKVIPGCLYVALGGPHTHGAKFIKDALKAQAKVILYEKGLTVDVGDAQGELIAVENPHRSLTAALKNFYQVSRWPLRLIGVTGTNGKTTLTYLLESIYTSAKKSIGVIGTVNHRYAGKIIKATNTTPGLVDNYALLSDMVDSPVHTCVMEVSSHALDQKRVEGLNFHCAIYTNLTSDHLDYHENRENYFLAKAKLFTELNARSRAVINLDDELGPRLREMTSAPVWTYAINQPADFSAREIELGFAGSQFELVTPVGSTKISTPLIGLHNIYNLLAATAAAVHEEIDLSTIKAGIEALKVVPGRLERIEAGQNFYVFVDYAHTEDALKNVLSSFRQVSRARVTVVFGCGGDRDRSKRPRMASVAEIYADHVIVTMDNPRTEDPSLIIKDILKGFRNTNHEVILDRKEAISAALRSANPGDVILIAGKGHEDYQIFKDQTISFDERAVVRSLLKHAEK